MKVAILTNFMEFQPGYSLTGIVKDQATMLTQFGHEVLLFVNDQYHGESFDDSVTLKKKIPFTHLIDYKSVADITEDHHKIIEKTANMLIEELADVDIVLTHDFLFTGWFMLYGQACKLAGAQLPNVRWLHWVHSVPTGTRDWWDIRSFGNRHKLVYPNRTDMVRVAESFKGLPENVRVIPHIKDMRSWFDFDAETLEFLREYPNVMQADVVQVYPCSVDRLEAKRLREVILLFSKIKKMGRSICLVVANQWATGRQQKESIEHYKKIASRNDVELGTELIFTSDWKNGKYDVGLPRHILRNLMEYENLFFFPTREESFGLVLPEAALTSGAYCVLNKSLTMQLEVSGFTALNFDFGSFHQEHGIQNEEQYLRDIAFLTIGRMGQNESIMTRTLMRKKYNWDTIYLRYYAPIFEESKVWV